MKKILGLLLIFALTLSVMGVIPVTAEESDDTKDGMIASFHVIYDVHVTRDTAAYERALQNMGNINPKTSIALVIGGDNTINNRISELDTFYGLLERYNPVTDEQTVVIIGNHDARGPNKNGNWISTPTAQKYPYWDTAKQLYAQYNKNYMPESAQKTIYHAKEIGGYTFIALNTDLGLKDYMHMSDEYLAWFEQTMKEAYEADPTKPIFIICHQAMKDTVWRTWNSGLGYSGNTAEKNLDEKVQKILEKYPTSIFISGHMHNELNEIEAVFRPWGTFIDVPAHYADPEKNREGGLGYEVEIYADKVVFRAVNFATNQWYPERDMTVPTANGGLGAVYQAARARLVEYPDNFDMDDRILLSTLNGMLTKKYSSSSSREGQFYYTAKKVDKMRQTAEELKAAVGPMPGDLLTLSQSDVKLMLGSDEATRIEALVGESVVDNKHVVWTSSNENAVTVVDGQLTAVGEGTATISAASLYDSSVVASCTVSVTGVSGGSEATIPTKGCRGSIGAFPLALMPALAPIVLKKKKK